MPARTILLSLASIAIVATPLMLTSARAMQNGAAEKAAGAAQTPASVLALDQAVAGKAVTMKYVYLPIDGHVAIYGSDETGKRSGEALGYAPLGKGDHRDVSVELASAPKPGAVLWASLYKDVDGDKKLDVKTDTPFWQDLPSEGRFEVKG